jgi:hypothetical protein
MPLHWLFPTPVMQVDLTPDDGIAAEIRGSGAALFGVVRPGRHYSPRTGSRNAHALSHGLGSNGWLVLNLRESGQQRSLHDRRV